MMLLNATVRRTAPVSMGLALTLLAGTALADLPPALDRTPSGAAVTIAVRDISKTRSNVERMLRQFDENAAEQMAELDAMTEAEGFNKSGSMSFVMLGDPSSETFAADSLVLILPISDWGKFAAGMGGEAGKKTTELPNLNPGVVGMDLGGGYAALGMGDALESFKNVTGQIKDHKAQLGATGAAVAESADVVAFINVQKFSLQIDAMVEQAKSQMEMYAGMAAGGNPEAEKGIQDLMQGFGEFARDAQSFAIALSAKDGNTAMDMAVHFKEGSLSQKRFTHTGGLSGASSIVGSMPKMPFLTAFAMDMSHPFIKSTVARMNELSKAGGNAAGVGGMWTGSMEKVDAVGFMLGSNPALLSTGLFAKALTFQQTKDPAGLLNDQRAAIGKMSMNQDGIKVDAKLTPDAVEIAGQKVDKLKTTIEIDPDSPAAQAQQFLTLFTGTSGEMGGMMTATKTGVLATMSANTDLMTKAIQAQKGEGSLATDAEFKAVASSLPDNRAFEGYLGVKGLSDTIAGVLQLFGQPMPVEIKDELPPIGLGVTAGTGGLRARLVIPDKVVATFADVAKKMQEMQEGEAPAEQPADQPGERRKPRL
jgi:hypothetical protein